MCGESSSHLVLIPSYNTGPKLFETVRDACAAWTPVWVVIDGSTDGTGEELERRLAEFPGLQISRLERNRGKGAAILHGLREAAGAGYTHALTMDSDGQHSPACIAPFMTASMENPEALILGKPVFDDSAPWERVLFRKLCNWWANVETLWAGIGDSLFGMRVYPIRDLLAVMENGRWARRFDFDAETAVRLCWRGLKPLNIPAPVHYFHKQEGGVSHFNYIRDNLLLSWMHLRLFCGFAIRLPMLLGRRTRSSRH